MSNQELGTAPDVRFPPPLVFLGFILLGLLLDELAGLPDLALGDTAEWMGFSIAASGAALIIISLGLFGRDGENPEPWTGSTTLIARGPYRHTRNPMYLGMVAIHLGFAIWWMSPGALVTAFIALLCIDRLVIVREEIYLLKTFGAPYADYCRNVRRWL